jgi:hypothetical protein
MRWGSVVRTSALALVLAISLSSCGGGGGSSGGGNPAPPTPSATAPTLTQQPAAASVPDGGSATFSVAAGGSAPLAYQWQRNGQDIAGATSATLTVEHLVVADSGAQYRVVVSNAVGSVTSSNALLTVTPAVVIIGHQPTAIDAREGATLTLQAGVTGSGVAHYQWFRAGQPIDGATAASITVGPLRYGDDVDYAVQVGDGAAATSSGAATVRLGPAAPARPLGDCAEITAPGSYSLAADMSTTSRTAVCVSVHDTHDVQIDCANHKLSGNDFVNAIRIERVDHFSLKNCSINSAWTDILQSRWGSVTGNSLTSDRTNQVYAVVNGAHNDHIVLAHNSLFGSYQDRYSTYTTTSNNQVYGWRGTGAAGIISSYTKYARIFDNVIDGRWDGQPRAAPGAWQVGLDDGIVIDDISEAIVENNSIRNVWDCGIEWSSTVSDSIIRGNSTDNAGICAIGGWYWSSVSNVQFLNNRASSVPRLFLMNRAYGLRPAGTDLERTAPADTEVRFRDNVFDGNVLLPPLSSTQASIIFIYNKMGYAGDTSGIAGERVIPDSAFNIGNNLFRNNDFGAGVPGPDFGGVGPAGMVVDGGGNKCAQPLLAQYPLKCN